MFAAIGLNWVDGVLLILILIGAIDGLRKGALEQLFGLGGIVVALLTAPLLSHPFINLLHSIFDGIGEKTAGVIAYILAFIIIVWICSLVGRVLKNVVNLVLLGFVDKIIGAVVGVVKSLIVIGLLMQILNATTISYKAAALNEENSALFQPIDRFTTACLKWSWGKIVEEIGDIDLGDKLDLMPDTWEEEDTVDIEI